MEQTQGPKNLKVLIIILAVVILAGIGVFCYQHFSKADDKASVALVSPPPTGTISPRTEPSPTASPFGVCTPPVLSEEETAILDQTVNNATYHFSYKIPREWAAAGSNTDTYASFAEFPWGDESLAAVNFIMLVGNEDVADFPVGDLVEEESRSINVGPDCVPATYKVYQKTRNERWDKDEYHIRVTFTRSGIPYLVILNYPFQGASADGDVVDTFNSVLKTIDFS